MDGTTPTALRLCHTLPKGGAKSYTVPCILRTICLVNLKQGDLKTPESVEAQKSHQFWLPVLGDDHICKLGQSTVVFDLFSGSDLQLIQFLASREMCAGGQGSVTHESTGSCRRQSLHSPNLSPPEDQPVHMEQKREALAHNVQEPNQKGREDSSVLEGIVPSVSYAKPAFNNAGGRQGSHPLPEGSTGSEKVSVCHRLSNLGTMQPHVRRRAEDIQRSDISPACFGDEDRKIIRCIPKKGFQSIRAQPSGRKLSMFFESLNAITLAMLGEHADLLAGVTREPEAIAPTHCFTYHVVSWASHIQNMGIMHMWFCLVGGYAYAASGCCLA